MNLADANSFATSTAGYLTGILTPVATVLVGSLWVNVSRRFRTIERTLQEQNTAMTVQSQGLAVVVSQMTPMTQRLERLEVGQSELMKSTAVLSNVVERHEQWHERHDETERH